jgi:secreted trypsin-like serine protease
MRHRRASVAIVAAVLSIGLVGAGVASAAQHRRGRAKIVGGTAVPAGALPQLAFVQFDLAGEAYSCSGTVLSANVVLTAGHCAYDDATGTVAAPSGFLVATGRPDLADPAAGQLSGVSQVIPYPGYNPATHDGDAALLELSTPTTAPAITLAPSNETALWQIPTEVAIAGWGLTDGSDPYSQPSQVQWATTVTQKATYCAQAASQASSYFDASGQLCAIGADESDQTSTCSGDSGGPVLANYLTANPVEVGITSWGIGNSSDPCLTNLPDFFTSTSSISAWAENWVSALAPPAPPVPAPTPSPTPTPAPSQPLARAGHYFGYSSQNKIVKVSVVGNTIRQMKFNYGLRCHDHARLVDSVTVTRLPLTQLAFSSQLHTHDGELYRLAGRFTTSGSVKGTMSTTWHSNRYGICRSGLIHWKAST